MGRFVTVLLVEPGYLALAEVTVTAMPSPCQHGGHCTEAADVYTCDCGGTGYTGANCEIITTEYCQVKNPCEHGTCSVSVEASDYSCTCTEGYTGKNCEININECDSNPCTNGGVCEDLVNDYKCVCESQ